MPFQETRALDEAVRFVTACLAGEETMSELCRGFGISRQWGYELMRRYQAEGWSGLEPRSRAPHHPGQTMAAELAAAIVAQRLAHPRWGPKKLKALLERRKPETTWPAASSIGDLLRREGLVRSRRRRRTPLPLSQPFAPVTAPNDLWGIDFKGWFRTGDGVRCDPLTLSDADSRFLLVCESVEPTIEGVDPVTDAAFREYGLPLGLRSDNGPPFAGNGAGGLTRLAVKWIKLGIRLERIDPGAPEQNGRHERMHGTLKADTAKPPAATLVAQQASFDCFRLEYNHLRPHEALGQETPASRYHKSPRGYPARIEEPAYDAEHAVRRVRSNGEIKWGGTLIFVSEALVGEPVGVAETETGDWIVRFADLPLGLIDRRTHKLRPFAPTRPGRRNQRPQQHRKSVNDVSGL
ncbi:MAG TPA: integrase core domain-containing protein [Kribbella sp.]|nr:integrase core domain-containing protein [Kribbella sp.]HET6295445.1 integrase core domain-containing protein [Kribbella sp.]